MKKLSKIFGFSDAKSLIETKDSDYSSGYLDGIIKSIHQIDEFEIDYECFVKDFTYYRYDIDWQDLSPALRKRCIQDVMNYLPPEKLFKKKVG